MSSPQRLALPLDSNATRALRVGEKVLLSGLVVTARDAAHRYLAERPDDDSLPFDLSGALIYHCGPVLKGAGAGATVVSAGPTTSMRMEMYQARVIERYGLAGIIGKGGMGPDTARALAETGAVYLAAPSGAGALLAGCIKSVTGVSKLDEFGSPEALWGFEVEDLPAVVAMDSDGGNLYSAVEADSRKALSRMIGKTILK
jgi:fumarate hydratase class I